MRRLATTTTSGPRRLHDFAMIAVQGPLARDVMARLVDGELPKPSRKRGEESPGSTERRCRVTPGGGDPRESATESRPPRLRPGKVERVR